VIATHNPKAAAPDKFDKSRICEERRLGCSRQVQPERGIAARVVCCSGTSRLAAKLNFDFETHLHNLSGRDSEIRRWQVGVEVHGGEQGLPPDRHA